MNETTTVCATCGTTDDLPKENVETYPYCRSCHYSGAAENHLRQPQIDRFRAAFPDARYVGVEHTGGGCFWLALRWEGEAIYYALTDGEASVPWVGEDDGRRPLVSGGWGYVGRYSEDESSDDYEGTALVAPAFAADDDDYWAEYPAQALSDDDAIAAIRNDRAARTDDLHDVFDGTAIGFGTPEERARWRRQPSDLVRALETAEEAGYLDGSATLGTRGQDLVMVAAARLLARDPNGCRSRFASILDAVQSEADLSRPRLRLFRDRWPVDGGNVPTEVEPDWRHHFASSRALARGEREYDSDGAIVAAVLDASDPGGIAAPPYSFLVVEELESPSGAYCVRLVGSRGVLRKVLTEQWGYSVSEAEEQFVSASDAPPFPLLAKWNATSEGRPS